MTRTIARSLAVLTPLLCLMESGLIAGCSATKPSPEPHSGVAVPAATSNAHQDELDHWRTVPISAIPTAGTCNASCVQNLNQDDGNYLQWIACTPGANSSTEYTNPTEFQFSVPDYASITDATLTFDVYASGAGVGASLSCLDASGNTLATFVPNTHGVGTSATRSVFEVPLTCFANPTVRIRVTRTGGSCLAANFVQLNVRSDYRRVPISSVPSRGSCTQSCVDNLNQDDGNYLQWIACSNGNNSATEYDTPTDFHFVVPDYASVTSAAVDFDVYGSGTDARMRVTCVDGAGNTLGSIFQSVSSFPTTPQLYRWTVPTSCFTSPEVIIRVERLGGNCLGADFVSLGVVSNARALPVAAVPSRGSCTQSCVDDLNRDDGTYLQWIACSNGGNTSTEYDTPTDFRFDVPDYALVSQAVLALDAYGSGSNAVMKVSCVDGAGNNLATVYQSASSFPSTPKVYAWDVPAACFTSPTVTIRIERLGNNCLGADYIRLYATSSVPRSRVFNAHAIEGYADRLSVAPGQAINFKVHSPRPTYSLEISRWGQTRQVLHTATGLTGALQHPLRDAYRLGAGWTTSYTLTIPTTWQSGMYAARLYDDTGAQSYVTFVVKEQTPGASTRLAVLASTNTWTAYNDWGGASYYGYGILDGSGRVPRCNALGSCADFVSMERPNPSATPEGNEGHLANGELHVLRWLESTGYSYAMLADTDVHQNPAVLRSYGTVIINTHSEYWSQEMYDALVAFLNAGGNLLYLSGNGIYWKVTLQGSQVEVRKDATNHAHTGQPGGLWRDLGRPEASVLGVQYDGSSWGTAAPYRVLSASHWAFANTGLSNDDLIGKNGLNLFDGGANGWKGAASGWEVDHTYAGVSPSALTILARGLQANGSEMTYYDHPGGGGVFSAGSLNFGGSLVVNPHLSRVVSNVLGHFGIQPQASSTRRIVPISAIPSLGTCTGACVSALNRSNAVTPTDYLRWIACSNGLNSSTEYDSPTNLQFSVPDYATVTSATLSFDVYGSGSDAVMRVACVDGAGNTLGTLFQSAASFPTTPQVYLWDVPLSCFAGPTVTVRVTRLGGNCLAADYIALNTVSP